MIIIVIILFLLFTYLSWFLVKARTVRWIAGCLSFMGLAASLLLLTGNFAWNWGMKTVSKTQSQTIYTAGETAASYGILVKQELGTSSDNYVFVYRTEKSEKTAQAHFVPDKKGMINASKKSATYQLIDGNEASLTTTTTSRDFKNSLWKFLFDIGQAKPLISEKSVVKVPKTSWMVLTETQAKELQEKAPELIAQAKQAEATAQTQFEAQLKEKLTQAAQTGATNAELAEIQSQAEQDFKIQLQNKANDPTVQIAAIKKLMGW